MIKKTLKDKNNIKAVEALIDKNTKGVYDSGAGQHWVDPSEVVPTITCSNAGRLNIIIEETR